MSEITNAMEAMVVSLTKKIVSEVISTDLVDKIAEKVAAKILSGSTATITTTSIDGSSYPSGHCVWKDGTTSVNLGVGKPILYRNEDGSLEPTHYMWFRQRKILLREEDSRIYSESDGFSINCVKGRFFYIKLGNRSLLWKTPVTGNDEEFIINTKLAAITEGSEDEVVEEAAVRPAEVNEEVAKEEEKPLIPIPIIPLPKYDIPEGFYPLKSDDFAEGLYAYSPLCKSVFDAVNGITTNERLVVFRADGTRRTFNFRFPGHMALIKAACVRGEEEVIAESAKATTSNEFESDEWRWLTASMFGDSMRHLPTGKYKIYRNGRIENCITGEFLKSFKATSGSFEYKMYRISDASLSTGEKGAPTRLSHGLSVRLEKLIWLAFKWDRRTTLPRNLKIKFLDGDTTNYNPDNIEAINI
jgi:hypothetical protein